MSPLPTAPFAPRSSLRASRATRSNPRRANRLQPPAIPTHNDVSVNDLRRLTNDMVDYMLDLISDCTDEHVTFEPSDPEADDPVAATPEEVRMPWTLGHVIVHTTASAEESAALAAELARGVE